MDIFNLITPENFIPSLRATTRWEAIDELIAHLLKTGKIKPEHRDSITAAVKKRETSMSTGIGFGIAIPHANVSLINEFVCVVGKSRQGLEFEALDRKPVHLVWLFLVPQGQFLKHVNVLSEIAKRLHQLEFHRALEARITAMTQTTLPHKLIEGRLQAAVRAVLPDADVSSVLVRPCPDPKFGDYQSTAVMAIAKARKLNPRQIATDVLAKLDLADICEKVDIAGAGFLNFRLKHTALLATLTDATAGKHLFFEKSTQPRTVVVDFSSPNVAKPMHVGHIRSTGIGDALQRCLLALGHHVITDNHIGDWGTQFGMLLLGWKRDLDKAALGQDAIAELVRIYKIVNTECERDTAVLDAAKQELVKLQAGDAENLGIWREMVSLSQTQFDSIYSRLGIKFEHQLGESFYNSALPGVVNDLLAKGIARESQGAVGVFSDGSMPPKEDPFLVNRDGEWVADPALVRKSDGGFNYTTTDLATLDYRFKTWSPQEILYVVDDRQSPHFKKLFLVFGRWQPDAAKKMKLVHIGFGKIMGDDGKPFKTRSGDTVKLGELLDEAQERAFKLVESKQHEKKEEERLPESLWPEIARVVGIASVKYADLLPNRQSDYVFSWDKMLALNGNTAPYLLYAYARVRSIFRKAAEAPDSAKAPPEIQLIEPAEIALAKHLLNFGLTLEAVAEEYRPNFLCNYLYELATLFSRFFENCPVLKAEPATRASRLALCNLTALVLKQGLEILGIEVVEQM